MPKRTSALTEGTSSRRWTRTAATTSASSGGRARAASTRCAAPREAAPLTTASNVARPAKTAVRRSQGPGLDTGLRQSPPQVAERPGTRYVRQAVEVLRRGRRGGVPLEGVREPGVVHRARTLARRLDDVDDEQQESDRHHARADRRDQVVGLPQSVLGVRVDPSRHAEEPEQVLREERQVEAEEHEPELSLSQPLVEHAPEDLGPPVVEAREDSEHRAAEQDVVHVRDDVVRVGHLPVDWESREEDPREPTDS